MGVFRRGKGDIRINILGDDALLMFLFGFFYMVLSRRSLCVHAVSYRGLNRELAGEKSWLSIISNEDTVDVRNDENMIVYENVIWPCNTVAKGE